MFLALGRRLRVLAAFLFCHVSEGKFLGFEATFAAGVGGGVTVDSGNASSSFRFVWDPGPRLLGRRAKGAP